MYKRTTYDERRTMNATPAFVVFVAPVVIVAIQEQHPDMEDPPGPMHIENIKNDAIKPAEEQPKSVFPCTNPCLAGLFKADFSLALEMT